MKTQIYENTDISLGGEYSARVTAFSNVYMTQAVGGHLDAEITHLDTVRMGILEERIRGSV